MRTRATLAAGLWTAGVCVVSCNSGSSPPGALGNTEPSEAPDGGGDSRSLAPADAAPDDDAPDSNVLTDATGTDSAGAEMRPGDGPANDAPGQVDVVRLGPRCDPTHAWMSPSLPTPWVPQAGFGRFGGVGADELTIAWTSAAGTIYVADRAARGSAFGAPTTIDTTSIPLAVDRVALDATGMVVFAVSADRTKFIAFSRSGAGAAWAASAPLQFANVHAMASAEVGGQFSDPVLGADGLSFFYVLASSGALPVLYESKWDVQADAWTTGLALPNSELSSADAGTPTHASGVSSDALTLFYYDGVTAKERAAWRDTPSSPFVRFADLPGLFEAAPNYRCDALYFQATDPGGAGVFIAQ